jgi:hypothetical protein
MHMTRTFMPPFPGNDKEAEALAAYLKNIQEAPALILDAQSEWKTRLQLQVTTEAQP